jgi:hypothetical protein
MQYLDKLETPLTIDELPEGSDGASYYAIRGDYETPVSRYVCTTPETREVCSKPEVLGCRFTGNMSAAMTKALRAAPFRGLFENTPHHQVCVLNFLRGGLNFDLRDALHEAYGFNTHSSAFMSSQRYRTDGRWQVKEDMYRKLQIPRRAVIVLGDVVATGVTVRNGLQVLLDHIRDLGSSLRGLVFFTIGCHKLEKNLGAFDTFFRESFPDYEATHLVYLEGKFKLVDSRTEVRIGLPGTDLISREALLAPELIECQYDSIAHHLERCVIYDAGSRAFDIPTYVEDVVDYWKQTRKLARQGWTLREALAERWPADGYSSKETFLSTGKALWRGAEERLLERIHEKHLKRMEEQLDQRGDGSEALAKLCDERVETLESIVAVGEQ